jgi:hypothetical protein
MYLRSFNHSNGSINWFQSLTPYEFVEGMKKKGIRVPGIGHRYIAPMFFS